MWNDVVNLFQNYMGTGLIVIWFLICLIYLWVNEKRKDLRILFVYAPVIFLLMYFNPLFARIVYGVAGDEIYYRILWLLPITAVIAYTCVQIYGKVPEKKKGMTALCMAAGIAFSGSLIYVNPFFGKAENMYHVPDSVVNICDAIVVPGREVKAVFPKELLQYVRQYSPVVCMPYGREVLVDRWNNYNFIYEVMEVEVLNVEDLVWRTREEHCHYIVLREEQKLYGEPEAYGLELFLKTDGYVVYRDPVVELTIPVLTNQ